jgi:O-acetylhomoserine/O-acetylserine sulfhydrylase-like pyridoxal-dependent enzyme
MSLCQFYTSLGQTSMSVAVMSQVMQITTFTLPSNTFLLLHKLQKEKLRLARGCEAALTAVKYKK